ncbi:hypothetical protein [Streptomyces sp. SPB074]|nr:hypothetical protein [Streptomyces sp. SPB074]
METTTAPLLPGRTVHVFVQGEPSDDPFLMRPSDAVPVHSRTT